MPQEFVATLFASLTDRDKEERSVSLETLPALLRSAVAPVKERLPLVKLGRFGDQRTPQGLLRHTANLLAITGIEGDHDDGTLSIERAVDLLTAAGIHTVIDPSAQHTAEKPRWHIFCPTSTELPPQQRDRLMARLNGVLQGALQKESWTPAQCYFFGAVVPLRRPGAGSGNGAAPLDGTFAVRTVHGARYINQANDLDAGALDKNGKPYEPDAPTDNGTDADTDEDDDEGQLAPVEWVEAALACLPNDGRGGRPWDSWAGENGWSVISMAVFRATEGSEEGFEAFHAWSAQNPKYKHLRRPPGTTGAKRTRIRWEEVRRSPPDDIGWIKLRWLAEQYDEDFDPVESRGTIVLGPWEKAAEGAEADDVAPGAGTGSASTAAPGAAAVDPDAIVVYDSDDDYAELEPPREWLLGRSFCRGMISTLSAPGGEGKTSLRLLQAMALATGEPLSREQVWQCCRVLVVSFEDDRLELRRRFRALRLHHKLGPEKTAGRLHYASLGPRDGKLMELDKKGRPKEGTLRKKLRQAILAARADMVFLDPLVKTHAVPENDNTAMDLVAQCLTDLVQELGIGLDIAAHDRKGNGEAGDQSRNRGASATIDAHRLNYTLTKMTEAEGKRFGIEEEDERRRYTRYDSSKVNLCPPQKARWYYLADEPLGNSSEIYPDGDRVQVAEPWDPPPPLDGTTDEMREQIVAELGAGMTDGQRYSDASKATDLAAWKVVQKHCADKNEAQCRIIIKELVKTARLYSYEYKNPVTRKRAKGLHRIPKEET